MFKEFRDFLLKGNVVDMAVGFIFGAAFATIVKSLVSNVIMPPIGLLLGNVDFSSLFIALDGKMYASLADLEKAGAPAIKLGVFFNDFTSFVILGFVMFMMIKGYSKIAPKKAPETITKTCPECAMNIPVAAKKCPYCGSEQV
ncbi:large conductance mechanosensitive channel protein MscL [Sulfurospirillum halorespirans]|uniref:Large-conductance mechanosensitive channel n=1 Tax=Sulfurospirillum halorespirans DSM 13726 TaxID=1193502 RepID=A0A1D7TH58_9BACT|nr:large conductance mechanosensitive channel protein MscL [Sulfurospirillum halorespirans]AOO64313.1 large-conductance mechanosensitive channel [Sulfurospirillum halorespirans DSM 13726]